MIKDRDGNKRLLHADEIECRVGQMSKSGNRYSILLYKTSRTDMDILDEIFGPENWQSAHYEVKGKDFCSISVRVNWDEGRYDWVSKSDCGSESNIEAEKGEASDAFKRAGFQWGIGRELYTAPRIWLSSDVDPFSLSVSKIGYDENDRISELEIRGKRNGQWEVVYPEIKQEKQTQEKKQTYRVVSKEDRKNELIGRLYDMGGDVQKVLAYYKVSDLEDLSEELLDKIVKSWERRIQSEAQQG